MTKSTAKLPRTVFSLAETFPDRKSAISPVMAKVPQKQGNTSFFTDRAKNIIGQNSGEISGKIKIQQRGKSSAPLLEFRMAETVGRNNTQLHNTPDIIAVR